MYGWAFGVGATAAAAAAAAAAANSGDKKVFSYTQTIDKAKLLELTNGRTWDIEQNSGDCNNWGGCSWSWTLSVESWGCADLKPGRTG
jgi:hypothetical protein